MSERDERRENRLLDVRAQCAVRARRRRDRSSRRRRSSRGRSLGAGHVRPERLRGGFAARERDDDASAVHHGDAVGEREDLDEVRRDEQDRLAVARARARSWSWMNSIAPTSTPRVGCAARSTVKSRPISRAMTIFC